FFLSYDVNRNLHSFPTRRSSDLTVVGYRDQGLGHIVYIGFDYFEPNDTASRVIGNTLSWINDNLVSDFVIISPTGGGVLHPTESDRKSTRLNSSHVSISYAVFCL